MKRGLESLDQASPAAKKHKVGGNDAEWKTNTITLCDITFCIPKRDGPAPNINATDSDSSDNSNDENEEQQDIDVSTGHDNNSDNNNNCNNSMLQYLHSK